MIRLNRIVIPLITVAVSVAGSMLTSTGMDGWYETQNKPTFTPPGSVVSTVWTILFILATISVLLYWNAHAPFGVLPRDERFGWILGFFILNALLNVFWSFLFFNQHQMYRAIWEAIRLG